MVLGADPIPCPDGVAVISQTCDARLEKIPHLLVALVVRKTEDEVPSLRRGQSQRYVKIGLDDDTCIDLDVIQSVAKHVAASAEVVWKFPADDVDAVSNLGTQIGRRFSRFPIPDKAIPWLAPLQKLLTDKSGHPAKPVGAVLDSIDEVRVSAANHWYAPGRELTLHVILKRDVLSARPDDTPPIPSETLADWLNTKTRTVDDIAARIPKANGDDLEILWQQFVERLAERCLAHAHKHRDYAAGEVTDVVAVLATADDFTLYDFRRSQTLDLEFLSDAHSPVVDESHDR